MIKSFFTGFLTLCLVLVSTIISTFKTGVGAVIDTALISICLLKVFHALSKKTTALADCFARAFLSCAIFTGRQGKYKAEFSICFHCGYISNTWNSLFFDNDGVLFRRTICVSAINTENFNDLCCREQP